MQLDELQLAVPDLAATAAFYAGVLRLVPLPADSGVAFAAGRTRLSFRAVSTGEQPHYHIAFAVPLARFDEARRLVAAHTSLITADGDEVIVHAPRAASARLNSGQWLTTSHRRPALPL